MTPSWSAYWFQVEAFDWNCQQHITPRFTQEQIRAALGPIEKRMQTLERENKRPRTANPIRRDRAEQVGLFLAENQVRAWPTASGVRVPDFFEETMGSQLLQVRCETWPLLSSGRWRRRVLFCSPLILNSLLTMAHRPA
jgi:hypothetical protein